MTWTALITAHDADDDWKLECSYMGFEEKPDTDEVDRLIENVGEAFEKFFGVPSVGGRVEVTEDEVPYVDEEGYERQRRAAASE
jgi:hypothetical protein